MSGCRRDGATCRPRSLNSNAASVSPSTSAQVVAAPHTGAPAPDTSLARRAQSPCSRRKAMCAYHDVASTNAVAATPSPPATAQSIAARRLSQSASNSSRPVDGAGPLEPLLGPPCDLDEMIDDAARRMPVDLPAFIELFGAVLAQRLQQPIPAAVPVDEHQRLVHQRPEQVEHVQVVERVEPAHRLCRLQVEGPGEHAQPVEQDLLIGPRSR